MPIERTCENCKTLFYCYPCETGRRFCSLTCRTNKRFNKELPAASKTPVWFTCRECGNQFFMMQSYLAAYRKKYEKEPIYCSNKCSALGRRKDKDERSKFTCLQCGKEGHQRRKPCGRTYEQQKFCSHKCKVDAQLGRAMEKFSSDSYAKHTKKRGGYVMVYVPTLATGKRHSILEHRLVMQRKLGRPLLPEETVHHKNGIRHDNSEENLELFSSRHGPGQRVIDKIAFAIEMIDLYPDFAANVGRKLVHLTDVAPPRP